MSMTREEAITCLQEKYDYCKSFYDLAAHPEEDYPETAKYLKALQIALSALRPITREQVENVWKGKWIHAMPILGSGDEEIHCSKCGNIVGFETAFCPYCGSPITDKAVDMVMKRLEELRDD